MIVLYFMDLRHVHQVNDELKEQFKGEVEKFKTRLESVGGGVTAIQTWKLDGERRLSSVMHLTAWQVKAVLNDRTVDNTMAGAEAKLQQFYDYKRGGGGA